MDNTKQYAHDFDGTFRFTNATDEDFTVLWNNISYTFKSGTCSPMIIRGETLENIQNIRKKFAYKLAQREFYKTNEYKILSLQGNGLPPTFDEEILSPWIEKCLSPLPTATAEIKEDTSEPKKMKAFKPVGERTDLKQEFA